MKKHLVIIPVFNELATVKKMLVAYIKNTDLKQCATCIIDDGSELETMNYVQKIAKEYDLEFLRNNKNKGKPKSINMAMHYYNSADIFTIIDSDIEIQTPRWNHVLEKAHRIFNNEAILGAKLHISGYEFQKNRMTLGDLFPFWTLPGGFFSLPRFVFSKLGFFYDKIHRHEDAEYCRRAATQNIRWYYTPNIKIRLLPHVSFANNPSYAHLRDKEVALYKKRSEFIMKTHSVYYNPFLS